MKLWVVRHAQPLIEPGVCYGATDMAADEAATRAAAEQLAAALPAGLPVVCSPLRRCVQLAQALAELRPDLLPVLDDRLREMHFGQWEGMRWDAIPQAAMAAWTNDFFRHRFGGEESVEALMQRVHTALRDSWQAPGMPAHHQQDAALWVTHAGVARAARLLAQGRAVIERADQWPREAPGFGQWVQLDVTFTSTGSALDAPQG